MIDVNDLKKDAVFLWNGEPYRVLELQHKKMARQSATTETKLRNLITGANVSRTFSGSERLEEAEIEKRTLLFLYEHRGEYGFVNPQNRAERFMLRGDELGEEKQFLKPNTEVTAEFFEDKIIRVVPPVKVDFKVIEAPPGIKGDTASGGSKEVIIETGAKIKTPLFIEAGDTIRVNTEKGEYAERASKGS